MSGCFGARLDDDEEDQKDAADDVAHDDIPGAEARIDRLDGREEHGDEAERERELAGQVEFASLGGRGVLRPERDEENDDGDGGRNEVGHTPAAEHVRRASRGTRHREELGREAGEHG